MASDSAPPTLFNRALLKQRRNAAATTLPQVDFLLRETAARLEDRLEDMQRFFPLVLEIGCHHAVPYSSTRLGEVIRADQAEALLKQSDAPLKLVMDEEWLAFAEASLDAVISNLSLHWVNDLPGCLLQLRRALKPDGLLLAVMPGARTLQELRESLMAVAMAEGKIAPRIAPFVEVRDAGSLLQRAGFALPVIDSETVTLTYENPLALLRELQQTGETNMLMQQHKGLTGKAFWPKVCEHYQQHYSYARGRIRATVELVFLTAWAPDATTQQQPAKRGSGKVNLTQVFS